VAREFDAQTRAIYVESDLEPANAGGGFARAAVEFARAHGLVSTIATRSPARISGQPRSVSISSLHSGTKYLNGHSDIVAGAIIGRADLIEKINRTLSHFGGSMDPHACFLLHRGLKTLGVRVRYQNASAFELARFLSTHAKVAKVNYPGLESNVGHSRARELFDGFGGMMSFELRGGVEAAEKFIDHLTLPISAPSLGGVESLITRPAKTSHSGMPRAERERAGISEGLIRLSVGLEATEDLIADFARALDAC
jgi:cystathionine beta-lyase/cystathionine gamma-synthase